LSIKELIAKARSVGYDPNRIDLNITDELLSSGTEERARFLVNYALAYPDRPLAPVADRLFSGLHAPAAGVASPPPLPTAAPALWRQDRQRGESPPDFIRRTYGPWLEPGMPRALLRNLDERLYFALATWLKSNELPDDVKLLKQSEANDQWVARYRENPDLPLPESRLEAQRLRAAMSRRKGKDEKASQTL
jgi:hypothetical protein